MMNSLPGFTITALLQEDAATILYRAVRQSDQRQVAIKALRPERCTPSNIEQLKHEYAICQQLNVSGTINACALELHQGAAYLILEDFGGQSLEPLGHFREPASFLKVAIQIVKALAAVHQKQIIHKDIKPANILVHPETGQVKIGNFGIAAFIPYGQQFVSSASRIEGSLPYLSPEQTGRVNRGIDYRSDLYSLGVTFYEMLTGQLPFQGSDPLEWVHCHIARQPVPPGDISRQQSARSGENSAPYPPLPRILSDIVLKLMAKVAEERYQSALGLQFDLEQCLRVLETTGAIEPFVLGKQDVSERLQIPQKLYGQEQALAQLLQAFEQVVTQRTPQLVLVSGHSGVGKSSLVNELHKPVIRERGSFISGKFDQYKRDVPYATIVQAFQMLVRQILTESEARLGTWKAHIQAALGSNGKLILDVIPEVELIIGEQPLVPALGPAEAQNRFNFVFQNFIAVFAQKERPLAVLLDDMQWADSATLNLIQTIYTGSILQHICFILVYRDNEVDLAHPFSLMMDNLRQLGTSTVEIVVAPLNVDCVSQLVAETLRCSPERSEPLAQLIFQKTGGNPFFINEFLKTLYQEGLLTFIPSSPHQEGSTGGWQWDLAQIEAKGITGNIVNLMIQRMQKLPSETQKVLALASCVGNRFDLETLAIVAEQTPDQTAETLREAILRGYIVSVESTEVTERSYCFYHDRIQQAAYALIADDQKQSVHLTIGRLLLKNIAFGRLDENIFDVVNQLNLGLELITEVQEKAELRHLNLVAAQKAKASTAYAPAIKYLTVATTLVAEDAWSNHYEQTFTLFLELSECLYLTGDLVAAEELFKLLLLNVRSKVDQASVYSRQLRLYQIAGKYEEALARGVEALQIFGIAFPDPDSIEQLQAATKFEREQVVVYLGDRQISDLLHAPVAHDPGVRAIISLLTTSGPLCYLSKPTLFPLVVLKAVNYSLQFGNTEESCFAYSMYSMLLVSVFQDIPGGYAFSRMTIELNEKLNDLQFRGTVLHIHGSHINVWRQHMKNDLPFLERGFLGCVEAGEITMANYNGYQGSWQILSVSTSLSNAHRAIQKYADFAQQCKHEAVYQTIRLQQQLLMNLRGLTHSTLTLSDDEFDELDALSRITEANFVSGLIFYHIIKLIVFFTHERYAEALKSVQHISNFPVATLALSIETDFVLYHALTLTAIYPRVTAPEQAEYSGTLKALQQQLRYWANHCPENFLHKCQLAAAEIARIEGRYLEAMDFYEQSIHFAREHEFVQFEALAHELAARFYSGRQFMAFARTYLREAQNAYLRWGAIAKVEQLQERYSSLLPQRPQTTNEAFSGSAEQLDFLSIVKASQTISSEILLPNLLQTLMQIVIEQAGAELGYLLLYRDRTLTLEVATQLNLQEDALDTARPLALNATDISQLPQSMLNYVLRTQESILLEDATVQNLFSEDEYVIRRRPRSVSCLPITYQSELLGIIYLENNATPGAFTQQKQLAFNILTTQIAISLENSSLYQGLEESQERLNLALDCAQVGIWDWNLLTNQITWSEQVYSLFGVTPDFQVVLANVFTRIHPDDVEPLRRSLDQAIAEGVEHNLEYRVYWDDGSVHHLANRGQTVFGPEGHATRITGVVLDITERKLAEGRKLQLLGEQAAREQAEAANRIKDEFLAILGHELRTPLNPIIGWTQMLRRGKVPPDGQERALEIIERNARLQTQLIDDLLDVSRIMRGSLNIQPRPLELRAVVVAALEAVRPLAEDKKVDIKESLAVEIHLVADSTRFSQVVWNLLTNAVKFTPSGGEIRVHLACDAVARLTVTDTGEGIEADFLPHVFERFRQADNESTRTHKGLGLGLFIVHHVVKLHGGRVWAESAGPGRGTTFTVVLPLLAAAPLPVGEVGGVAGPEHAADRI